MPTTVKTGWLNDKNGDKFAPKTLTSQVQTSDGTLIEDKIQDDLNAMKTEILDRVSTLEASIISVHSGTSDPASDIGEDGDLYLVTE